MPDDLRPVLDVSPADWLAPRLTGPVDAVNGTVPAGFPAYARIFHPATGEHDEDWVRWAEVAAELGTTAHPLMRWHALVGSADPFGARGSRWRGENPEQGNLAPHVLRALCTVLSGHTATPDPCWFAVWDGWAFLQSHPPEYLAGPTFAHPGRAYRLCTGPLGAAPAIGEWPLPDWFLPQSPNLFWPDDRAWCAATEIDFDSTLVAGDRALIDALLRHDTLETWEVRPQDRLVDRVNTARSAQQ